MCPPHLNLEVTLPALFLPAARFTHLVSGLYGSDAVSSEKEYHVIERLDGVVGRYVFIAMIDNQQQSNKIY